MKKILSIGLIIILIVALKSCNKDPEIGTIYNPHPYELEIPPHFPPMEIPENNPLTVEGVALGRRLFYDPIISDDGSVNCNSCHIQEYSFSHPSNHISDVKGDPIKRNAMPLINLGWRENFAWDLRSGSLLGKIKNSISNPFAINGKPIEVETKLAQDSTYGRMFFEAFGPDAVTFENTAKALEQFLRTLISGNSKFDQYLQTNPPDLTIFTPEEQGGFDIFTTELGDCFHCHGGFLRSDLIAHNNGLDRTFTDKGLGKITGSTSDDGKFLATTLRNIEYTTPYMHDGRFNTLEEVAIFYSFELEHSSTIDPLMKKANQGGIQLTALQRQQLIAFLKTFSDEEFINNPDHKSPF